MRSPILAGTVLAAAALVSASIAVDPSDPSKATSFGSLLQDGITLAIVASDLSHGDVGGVTKAVSPGDNTQSSANHNPSSGNHDASSGSHNPSSSEHASSGGQNSPSSSGGRQSGSSSASQRRKKHGKRQQTGPLKHFNAAFGQPASAGSSPSKDGKDDGGH